MIDSTSKANLLNTFFQSVFSPVEVEPLAVSPPSISSCKPSNFQLTVSEVAEALHPKKACGPDGIPGRLFKKVASETAPSLSRLFNLSLSVCAVPASWKLANINPVFKKDDPSLPMNYRSISLLSTISKVLERCVLNHCYPHLISFFYHLQHEFLKGRSTVTQLLQVYHDKWKTDRCYILRPIMMLYTQTICYC